MRFRGRKPQQGGNLLAGLCGGKSNVGDSAAPAAIPDADHYSLLMIPTGPVTTPLFSARKI